MLWEEWPFFVRMYAYTFNLRSKDFIAVTFYQTHTTLNFKRSKYRDAIKAVYTRGNIRHNYLATSLFMQAVCLCTRLYRDQQKKVWYNWRYSPYCWRGQRAIYIETRRPSRYEIMAHVLRLFPYRGVTCVINNLGVVPISNNAQWSIRSTILYNVNMFVENLSV